MKILLLACWWWSNPLYLKCVLVQYNTMDESLQVCIIWLYGALRTSRSHFFLTWHIFQRLVDSYSKSSSFSYSASLAFFHFFICHVYPASNYPRLVAAPFLSYNFISLVFFFYISFILFSHLFILFCFFFVVADWTTCGDADGGKTRGHRLSDFVFSH